MGEVTVLIVCVCVCVCLSVCLCVTVTTVTAYSTGPTKVPKESVRHKDQNKHEFS